MILVFITASIISSFAFSLEADFPWHHLLVQASYVLFFAFSISLLIVKSHRIGPLYGSSVTASASDGNRARALLHAPELDVAKQSPKRFKHILVNLGFSDPYLGVSVRAVNLNVHHQLHPPPEWCTITSISAPRLFMDAPPSYFSMMNLQPLQKNVGRTSRKSPKGKVRNPHNKHLEDL